MNDKDLQNHLRSLSHVEVRLSRHQRALRAKLLRAHARQQTLTGRFRGTFASIKTEGVLIMKKNTLVAGAVALGVSALVVGVLAFGVLQSPPASASQLLADATKKTQQMSQEEIDRINNQYRQDLQHRLEEARQSNELRVVQHDELAAFGGMGAKRDPSIKTYLTYTDTQNHRILIGLDEASAPLFIFDVDAMAEAGQSPNSPSAVDAPAPTMEPRP